MAIETLDDIVERLADSVGIYGVHDERCDLNVRRCRCCWVAGLKSDIRDAVRVERILDAALGGGEGRVMDYSTAPADQPAAKAEQRYIGDLVRENAALRAEVEALRKAGKAALEEMCNTTAPRDSFTEAVDALDAALAAGRG